MSFQLLKKAASVITLITFLATNSIYAGPDSKSIFKNKKIDYQKLSDKNEGAIQKKKAILSGEDTAQSESRKKETQKILSSHLSDISLIHIPEELGRVVEVYQNPGQDNSRLVVHIQDLHTNPEASLNLAKILEILLKDYNLGLVCSEGADGVVDTSSVSSFPDAKVREKVARLFINSGELTGEEYLSITKYPELPIWGIENKEIYFKNIAEFNNIMKFNPDSRVFISQAKKALEELKPKIYSKELLTIDQKESDYENQKAETADYLKYISFYLQKLNIPTANYKNVALLNETINQESGIDQQKIMQESQNLLLNLQSAIAGKSNRSDMDALMAKASLFKDRKISPFSFYSYLKDLANKHLKDQLAKYPNLTEFVDYLAKVNSLDSTKLFTEMEDLTYEIKQKLARNDEEKTLIQALRNIKFLESFFNLKVSNEELDYYLQNKESCKVSFFENFLKPVLKKHNLSSFIDFNPGLIDSHLQELEDFYNIAKSRDSAMFNNAVSEIEKRNIKVSALITGGFHTKGLTRLLKDKGYSYIVISPYSKTEIDEENYHFLLSGKRKPIEELIKQLDSQETQETANKPPANLRVPLAFSNGSKARPEDVIAEIKSSKVIDKDTGVALQRLNVIKENIQKDEFLITNIPLDLIERIEKDPAKQEFVINGLYEIALEYAWTINEYCNRSEVAAQKEKIIEDIQVSIYPPIFESLDNISKRIESGDLIPNAVSIRLSENDRNRTPKINMDTTKRKPKIAFFPMKGDPWQLGHKWCVYKLLGDGADIIITMEDNADPDRKPNLTSLVVREAQSNYLYNEIFTPYIVSMKFQRQYRRLFQCDGESILPTLIYENLEIASRIDWIYDAGYDHCNWTVEGKDGLDVPYKLFFGLKQLFKDGIDTNIIIRFQKRQGDSTDTDKDVLDKYQAMEAVAKTDILEFFTMSVREKILSQKGEFWRDVKAWLDGWQRRQEKEIEKICETEKSTQLLEYFYKDGKAALSRKNVKIWRKRFEGAIEWEKQNIVTVSKSNDLENWIKRLMEASKHLDSFDIENGEGKELADEFYNMVKQIALDINMKIEIFSQPMDTTSTKIREEGMAYTAASLPLIDSMLGMRLYPSYRDPETTKSDREIAAEVLGDMIDINFMCKEAKRLIPERKLGLIKIQDLVKSLSEDLQKNIPANQKITQLSEYFKTSGYEVLEKLGKEDKEIIATQAHLEKIQASLEPLLKNLEDDEALLNRKMKDVRITERILTDYHLGRYLPVSVDMELLLKKLNQRMLDKTFDSILLYKDKKLTSALENINKKLEKAYGLSLHAIDSYLVKCFIEDDMFTILLNSVGASKQNNANDERQARELIDRARDVIQKRAEQIVKESREKMETKRIKTVTPLTINVDGGVKAIIELGEKKDGITLPEEVISGLSFMPTRDFKQGKPLDMSLITTTRNAQEAIKLLKQAKENNIALFVQGHLRGVDGAGSSLDLPEFQMSLTKEGAKFPIEYPSTPTIASDFSVKINFEFLDDPDAIEYIAPDYGITADNPYKITGSVILDKNGRTTQKDAPAFIFKNIFGLNGVRITCEGISPMALAGGMESSNVFNVALIAAASMLSGANLSYADIFNLAVKLENDEFAGLTGGQGHIGTMTGGAYQHIWLSGARDASGKLINPYSAFSIPLLTTEEQFKAVEAHMMLVQAGKKYENGIPQVGRAASLTNNMWTDLLRDRDSIGLPLHQEKLGLTAQYTKALKEGDFDTVVRVITRYVEIRDKLCKRWLALAIDAHNNVQGLPSYASKYASKVFDKNNADYNEYKLIRDKYFGTDIEPALGNALKDVTLYNLGAESLVKDAKEAGIALMGLGAGGPGANLIAISAKGNEYTRKFLKDHGINELTNEDEARSIIRGTGELKGYMPFKIGREPLNIAGFDQLGLKLPEGPVKVSALRRDGKEGLSPIEGIENEELIEADINLANDVDVLKAIEEKKVIPYITANGNSVGDETSLIELSKKTPEQLSPIFIQGAMAGDRNLTGPITKKQLLSYIRAVRAWRDNFSLVDEVSDISGALSILKGDRNITAKQAIEKIERDPELWRGDSYEIALETLGKFPGETPVSTIILKIEKRIEALKALESRSILPIINSNHTADTSL